MELSVWVESEINTSNRVFTPESGTTNYIAYYPAKKTLEVEFDGGHVYHYHGVEANVWETYQKVIQAGGSSGIFVNTQIKPKYKYTQIK